MHAIPHAVAYTTSKAGITGFMESLVVTLRLEGYGKDVRCTCVMPYFVSSRQDLMNSVNLRFPPLSMGRVADETVNAMLRNEVTKTVPNAFSILVPIIRSFPWELQCIIRDDVLKEPETKVYHVNK